MSWFLNNVGYKICISPWFITRESSFQLIATFKNTDSLLKRLAQFSHELVFPRAKQQQGY